MEVGPQLQVQSRLQQAVQQDDPQAAEVHWSQSQRNLAVFSYWLGSKNKEEVKAVCWPNALFFWLPDRSTASGAPLLFLDARLSSSLSCVCKRLCSWVRTT